MSEQNNNEKIEETQVMDQAEPAAGGEPEKASAVKVRPKEKAGEAIRRELAAKGVWHTDNEVEDALDALYAAYEADGTVPTREAFAAACGNAEAGEAVAGMKDDPFVRKPVGKRVAAVAAVAVLVAVCAGAVAIALQPGESLPVAGSGSSVSEKADDGSSKPASSSKADDKEDEAEEKDAESEPGSEAEDGTEGAGGTTGGQQDDGGDGTGTQSQSGGTTGGTATGGGTQSKPSGGTGSAPQQQPAQPSQPAHTHTWVHHDAVYQTVHHDAVYNNVWHEPVTETVVVCLDCGAINPGYDHMKQHSMNGESGATTVETRVVQEGYNEQVLVSAAWDEQVLVSAAYDSCACGATK